MTKGFAAVAVDQFFHVSYSPPCTSHCDQRYKRAPRLTHPQLFLSSGASIGIANGLCARLHRLDHFLLIQGVTLMVALQEFDTWCKWVKQQVFAPWQAAFVASPTSSKGPAVLACCGHLWKMGFVILEFGNLRVDFSWRKFALLLDT